MTALNLLEAAKRTIDPLLRGIMLKYVENAPILGLIPFKTIMGNALKYNREQALPGVAFRGVNESFTPSTGVVNPQTESLYLYGGELDVDNHIIRAFGEGERAIQESQKIRALALGWFKTFIKGDNTSNAKEFDGLQARLTGSQAIVAGTASGGNALSLEKLDEAIDACQNPTHLIMNKTMRRKLSVASRAPDVGGYITYAQDAFGRRVTVYNDLPILIADQDNEFNEILPFTEPAPTGGQAATTSIYVVSLTEEQVCGIQNAPMMAKDLGELESTPAHRTRVEWDCSIAVFSGYGAVRLYGIKNAPVVA